MAHILTRYPSPLATRDLRLGPGDGVTYHRDSLQRPGGPVGPGGGDEPSSGDHCREDPICTVVLQPRDYRTTDYRL